jgi:hypothetical protein
VGKEAQAVVEGADEATAMWRFIVRQDAISLVDGRRIPRCRSLGGGEKVAGERNASSRHWMPHPCRLLATSKTFRDRLGPGDEH